MPMELKLGMDSSKINVSMYDFVNKGKEVGIVENSKKAMLERSILLLKRR